MTTEIQTTCQICGVYDMVDCRHCGRSLCSDCNSEPQNCDSCGDCIHDDDFDGVTLTNGSVYCARCANICLDGCVLCEQLFDADQDITECDCCGGSYCGACMDEHEETHLGPIRDPEDDGPPLVFHGEGPRFFGVELEIDQGGLDIDNAKRLLSFSKDEGLFWVVSDGSLYSGLEIVTQPSSLEFHLSQFPWEDIVKTAIKLGYRSHEAGTCGLHVHVSKDALGATPEEEDLTISKLILLFWRHWPQIKKFSRRTQSQISSWCNQQYSPENGSNIDKRALANAKYGGKGSAVNPAPPDTVEFRIFRGSLNLETIKATLQFMDVILDLVLEHDTEWIVASKWADVLRAADSQSYPELSSYLQRRHLRLDSSTSDGMFDVTEI